MGLFDDIGSFFGGNGVERLRHHEDLLSSLLVMAWMVEARDPWAASDNEMARDETKP